jgi:hypothetical protein
MKWAEAYWRLAHAGRDYSKKNQFLASIRCQAFVLFVGARSRTTKLLGLSLDSARQTAPCEHRFDGDARGEERDGRPGADAATGGDAVKPPSNGFNFLS